MKGRGGDVTMAAVARAARVSRQAVYLHFASRSELFLALIEYADEQRGLQAEIAHVAGAPSARLALDRMAALQTRTNPQVWPLARLVDAARRQDPAAEEAWQQRAAHRLAGCRALVDRLAQEKALRPGLAPDVAADLLWTMTSLRTWEDLVVTRRWTAAEYERRMTDGLRAALLRPPHA
jgi:AcrR family transcriptional regulator